MVGVERSGYDGFRDAVDLDIQDTGSLSWLRPPVARGSQLSRCTPHIHAAGEGLDRFELVKVKITGRDRELHQEVYRFVT